MKVKKYFVFNNAMDELAFVYNHYDKLIHLVHVQYFVRNHHNNFSSNDHLMLDDFLLILMMIMIEGCQEEANHDNHVVLYFDQDEQDVVDLKKSNYDYLLMNLVLDVYQNPIIND
jgi:hypothetical protein